MGGKFCKQGGCFGTHFKFKILNILILGPSQCTSKDFYLKHVGGVDMDTFEEKINKVCLNLFENFFFIYKIIILTLFSSMGYF